MKNRIFSETIQRAKQIMKNAIGNKVACGLTLTFFMLNGSASAQSLYVVQPASAQSAGKLAAKVKTENGWEVVPQTRQLGTKGFTVNTGNGIEYHGGLIMPYTVKIYLIWYGNWSNKTYNGDTPETVSLIKSFVQGIGGTGYQKISTTYGDTTDNVTAKVEFIKSVAVGYPFGKDISDTNVQQVIQQQIDDGILPDSRYSVYFLITSADVNEHNDQGTEAFCANYCGWHNSMPVGDLDVKYSWVGNPERCPSNCMGQTNGPNGDDAADGISNVMAHELNEAITDPDLNAWWVTSTGYEMGDLCAWNFGQLLGGSMGDKAYNETFGGHNWLLQTLWENKNGGGCVNYLNGPFHP